MIRCYSSITDNFFHNRYHYPLKKVLKVGCNCCPSFTTEYREFQESPYGTREQVQGSACPTSKPSSPKTKARVCRKVSLFAKAWVSITNTKRNREAKGEGCQETPDQRQDNTRHTVLRKTKPERLLHLRAERKGAQHCRQLESPCRQKNKTLARQRRRN